VRTISREDERNKLTWYNMTMKKFNVIFWIFVIVAIIIPVADLIMAVIKGPYSYMAMTGLVLSFISIPLIILGVLIWSVGWLFNKYHKNNPQTLRD
jgi:hypothetical protein